MTEPPSKDQAFINKLTGIVLENLSNENFGVETLYFDLITTNPDFDFLRKDSRFIKILDEFGLSSYNGVPRFKALVSRFNFPK